jgi:hypothetical protein
LEKRANQTSRDSFIADERFRGQGELTRPTTPLSDSGANGITPQQAMMSMA